MRAAFKIVQEMKIEFNMKNSKKNIAPSSSLIHSLSFFGMLQTKRRDRAIKQKVKIEVFFKKNLIKIPLVTKIDDNEKFINKIMCDITRGFIIALAWKFS